MTATATRPVQATPSSPSPARPSTTGPTPTNDLRWMWIAAEVLLVATTIASALMLKRIFAESVDGYAQSLLFTAIVGHLVMIAMRWFNFGVAAAAAASFAATMAAIVALHYADTAIAFVFPSGGSFSQFQADLDQAREVFQTTKTPVPPLAGFLVAASLAFWVITFAADWAAFRLRSPGQALAPYVGVLIFVAMLGTEQDRLSSTAIALVYGVLFLLAHRAASQAGTGVWLGRGPTRGYVSLLAAGGVVAIVATIAGIVGGPAVPGANEAPLIELGEEGRQENKPLEVISPLVQIQPRLVDQSDDILFVVESTDKAYWRIAALDVFDGNLWRSQGQFRSTSDELPVEYPTNGPTDEVRSTFTLDQLNVVWAPAPYLPTRFENLGDVGVNYEAESATFIVDTKDQTLSDGLNYVVTSQIPRFTGPQLIDLGTSNNEQVDSRYLDLPADYSPLARQIAIDTTAGLTDPYSQALALQNYFLDNFAYDIDVAKGHDIERLEDFLSVQRGYCEQFAGSFASMARSIGLPARVATGFTWGDEDPNVPGRYFVRGRHAHAWAEVFIPGAGWVAFDPTPGRGLPNATDYTGVPEAQDSFESPSEPPPQEQAAPPPPPIDPTEPTPVPTPTPPAEDAQPEEEEIPTDPAAEEEVPEEEFAPPADRTTLYRVLFVLAALAAWFFGVPALKRLREQRRIARIGTDPRRRITLAWATAVDVFEQHGQQPVGPETLHEYASRVQEALPRTEPAFAQLTALCVEAAYRSTLPSVDQAERAEALLDELKTSLEAGQSWPERNAREIDPRPLVRIGDSIADQAERLANGAAR